MGRALKNEPRALPWASISRRVAAQSRYTIIATAICLSVFSCIPHAEYGAEGQRCFENGACLAGLVCGADNVCARPGETSDGGGDVATDVGVPRDVGATDVGEVRSDGGDAVADVASPPDSGSDAGRDAGADAGADAGSGPVITSIDGTGAESPVNPRPEDVAVWDAHAADRVAAQRRISSAEKRLITTGLNLDEISSAELQGKARQGTHAMIINAKTATSLDLGWPAGLAQGGEFDLVVSGAKGSASAHVFFLHGEKGDKGDQGDEGPAGTFSGAFNGGVTFPGNATISGNLSVSQSLSVSGSYALPDCPSGYTRDSTCAPWASGCQGIVLCKKGADEIVKSGDFWIDRYETAIVDETQYNGGTCDGAGVPFGQTTYDYPSAFPRTGNFTGPLFACSIKNVKPSAYMTWFQTQEACALAGKRLCTNEEWQAAAAGTHDTTGSETGTQCHIATTNTSARNTGLAGSTPGGTNSCVSKWGAEDMIGNLWEWVSMWGQAGPDHAVTDGAYAGAVGSGKGWDGFSPETTGDGDGTWNVAGVALGYDRTGSICNNMVGQPFAAGRGGDWGEGPRSGIFALHLAPGPTYWNNDLGARCCRGR
jgi:formylglycine-generating enzyme required for sulfatase activity